jgi:DNA modification methylase
MALNEIFCMDNIKGMKEFLPDESIDMTICSPPYEQLREYKGFSWDFQGLAQELYRVTKKGGVVVWVVGDQTKNGSESGCSFKQALYFKEIGFNIHDTMIYQKINYVPLTHNRYEQSFEYMFIFSKGKPKTFNPIMIPCKYPGKVEKYGNERRQNHGKNHAMRLYDDTEFKVTKNEKIAPNIFSYTLGKEKTGHPAPFPEKLAQDMILSWSNEGDIILDPFMGSGTTAKMAKINKRNYIGFEISKEYCELAEKRIKG